VNTEDVTRFDRAVVSWRDEDGWPTAAPATFSVDDDRGTIDVAVASAAEGDLPGGGDVTVLFSSIRPRPGQGYDRRRYVTVWGDARRDGSVLRVQPRRSSGWDETRTPFFELCERSVPRGLAYMRALEEERGQPVRPRLSRGWLFFVSTRVPFLSATVVPVVLGGMVARSHGASAWWWMLLALVGACAIHLGLNVANDVFDTGSGTDDANVTPTPFSGGSRVIQHGLVDVAAMRRLAYGLYAAGIAIGLVIAAFRTTHVLWIGLAGVLISWFYTAPPLRLVHRGIGDIAVAVGFGPLVVLGTEAVVARELTGEALYVSLPVGILCALILYVNQVPDRDADATAGKRTLAVRWSPAAVATGYAVAAAVAFALIALGALAGITPVWTLLALAPAPLARSVHRGIRRHYDSPYELMSAMGRNIALHALVGLGLIAGYVLDFVA
jgi:1,4-dihydroxy-2-naphthoate octaprenyltransferase